MVDMLHSKTRTNRIWTKEPIYRDSSLGNLDKTRVGETLRCPLQDGFYSDSQRSFPITVHEHTTPLASVQSVVSRVVSIVHCTAMRTPLRGVISVNKLKRYAKLLAVRAKKLSESSIRNAINLLINFLTELVFPSPNAEFFNGNGGLIRLGKVHDFFGDLTASGLDKISLLMFKPFEIFLSLARAFVGMGLKLTSSFKISSLSLGNIPAKVELFDHLRCLGVKDSNGCESRRANIDSNDKSSAIGWIRKFFFKDGGNFSIMQKGYVVEIPSIIEEGIKSFKLIIESNRDHKGFVRRISNLKTRITSFRFDESKPPLVESNGTSLKVAVDSLSFSPNIFSGFLNNVRGQKGGLTYV